jgi:hypothetical protein
MLKEQQRIYLIDCVCDPSLVWFLWAKLRLCARTDLQTFRCGRNNKGFIWFGRVCDPSLVWFLWAKRRLCARTDLQTFRRGRKTKDWFDWAVCVTELVWFLWAKFRFQFKNWPLDFQRKARIDFICVRVCVRERGGGDFLCVIVGDDFFFWERRGRSLRECRRKELLFFSAAFFASLLDFISFRILSILSHVCYAWFDYILQGFRTYSLRREKVFRRIENWRTF